MILTSKIEYSQLTNFKQTVSIILAQKDDSAVNLSVFFCRERVYDIGLVFQQNYWL